MAAPQHPSDFRADAKHEACLLANNAYDEQGNAETGRHCASRPAAVAVRFTLLKLLVAAATGLMCFPQGAAAASDSTVLHYQEISATAGGFTATIESGDWLALSLAGLGDLNGDGVPDLVLNADRDDDGGGDKGAVYILFLNRAGTVDSYQKISETDGGSTSVLDLKDYFGTCSVATGDIDGDGVTELAVGAWGDDDGGPDRGALYILFLRPDGTVKSHQKISATAGGFTATLEDEDGFGRSVAGIGDLDGDGVPELAAGVRYDDDGGSNCGAVYILFMNSDGTVKTHQKISAVEGGFAGGPDIADHFGCSVAGLGDFDGDSVPDLVVGANLDDGPKTDQGAIYILLLHPDGTVKAQQKVSATEGGFTGDLGQYDEFGVSVASLGDIDDDHVCDLVVGAHSDDDGGSAHGAVYVLFMNRDGTVKAHQKISDTEGNFTAALNDLDYFGISAAALGDVNADGVVDVAAGTRSGKAYVLFLQPLLPTNGDVDGDGVVDMLDARLCLQIASGNITVGPAQYDMADVDDDGDVDMDDARILAEYVVGIRDLWP